MTTKLIIAFSGLRQTTLADVSDWKMFIEERVFTSELWPIYDVRYMLDDRRACYVVIDHRSFYMNERDIEIIFELLMVNGFERVGSRRRPVFRPGTKSPRSVNDAMCRQLKTVAGTVKHGDQERLVANRFCAWRCI
jgi:hypothetical protein